MEELYLLVPDVYTDILGAIKNIAKVVTGVTA